jgi:glycerophosphoryl diester phosphodiesterase
MSRRLCALLLLHACASPVGGDETGGPVTGSGSSGSTSEVVTSTGAGSSGAAVDMGGEPGNLLLSDRVLNIAHRGGGVHRPEETLPAFEHALMVGADVLEFDVHATADGVLVAMHDATANRTTDGVGAIKDLSFAELRAFDAGYHFTPDDGATFPYRGTGIVVPTVDEILAEFPDSYYLIELKQLEPPIVEPLLAVLEQHGVLDRVVLASFDVETIAAVRAAAPEVLTALSLLEWAEFSTSLGDPAYAAPAKFVQPQSDLTSAQVVDFAHLLGLKVHPWTVNDAPEMMELLARGVDGIMTDDPELLAGLLAP